MCQIVCVHSVVCFWASWLDRSRHVVASDWDHLCWHRADWNSKHFFFVRCILGAPGSFVLVFPFWCFFVYSNAKVEAMLLNDFTQSAKKRQTSLTTCIIIANNKMIIYHACHSCPKVQWNFQNSTASHRHILSQSITSLQAQKTRQSNQYRATSRYFVLNELIGVFFS